MITLKVKVAQVLSGVCREVICGDPRDFATGQRICWRESKNRCYAQADGAEHLTELEYTLEIYDESAERVLNLFSTADANMCWEGFRREASAMQHEPDTGVHHITARYRALVDVRGNIYQ